MNLTDKVVMALLAVACIVILALVPGSKSDPCTHHEISPDTPTHQKEQCRSR